MIWMSTGLRAQALILTRMCGVVKTDLTSPARGGWVVVCVREGRPAVKVQALDGVVAIVFVWPGGDLVERSGCLRW